MIFPEKISVNVSLGRIDLYDDNSLTGTHTRLYGKNQYSINILHYLKTRVRKPGLVKNSKVLTQLHGRL